ncbi:MAG: restriction endonuclease [Bacteroides sp.]|nr:restriction endonuclease [Bacteroides sp.]
MAIPKHDEIRLPILQLLASDQEIKTKDFIQPLAEHFHLSDEEVNQMYPSGNGHIFYDRISWAVSYLTMSGLISKPQRGICAITAKGKELLKTPDKINGYIDEVLKAREPVKKKKKHTTSEQLAIENTNDDLTPQEILNTSFQNIRKSLYKEILEIILSKKPVEFERLVVQLLQKMGYGGEIKDSGEVTKISNDGGIDGIIKEDVLGLGRIHIQAKRYSIDTAVGREEIQRFVGALAVAQSNKGVFITTSYFSKGAIEYVKNLNGANNIVLIDGKKLAEYMYDFGLGVQTEQVLELKKLDTDFWDSMLDDKTKTESGS